LPNLRFFASPYFYHDAFLHHALHVLDAPANSIVSNKLQPYFC